MENNSNLNERVARLEQKTDNQEDRIRSVEQIGMNLTKLGTLLEMQTEINKEQQVQMKEFSNTLNKVNLNLDNLNNSQKTLQSEMTQIGNRVEKIEQTAEGRKIDLGKIAHDVFSKGLPTIITTIILTWLLLQFGLK